MPGERCRGRAGADGDEMNMPYSQEGRIKVSDVDLHPHLWARMLQRGVTLEELERTLNEGWAVQDAKPSTRGKAFVFPYRKEWEGQFFEEKEVSVY